MIDSAFTSFISAFAGTSLAYLLLAIFLKRTARKPVESQPQKTVQIHMTCSKCGHQGCWVTSVEIDLRSKIAHLYDAIAHGDLEHRAWLKAKIEEHFA